MTQLTRESRAKQFTARSLCTWWIAAGFLLPSCNPGPSANRSVAVEPMPTPPQDPATRPRSSWTVASDCPAIAAPRGAVLDQLHELLAQGRYADLEARLAAYDTAYAQSSECEGYVWGVYYDIWQGDGRRAQIDRWVQQRPDARSAHVARASLYYDLGHEARGTEYARETSEGQFAQMRRHFDEAARDAAASRRLGPVHMVAAGTMVGIARALGEPERATEWVDALLEAEPMNFGIRRRLMHSHEPRWGGSLEAMDRFAQESQTHADRNPRLRVLLGFSHAYRAMLAERGNDPRRVIEHLSRALEYGDFGSDWSVARALAYLETHQYDHARADIAYAKLWDPDAVAVWAASGRIFLAQQSWAEAIPEFDRAIQLEPGNVFNRTYRGFAHEKLGHWPEAAADYRAAVDIEEDAWRTAHLGIVLFRGLGREREAIPLLRRASELDSSDPETWFQLAQAQQSAGDTGAVESYRRFLEQPGQSADPERVATARLYLDQNRR